MLLDLCQEYKVIHGDCIEEMAKMPEESIGFSIFSPPFPSVFSYTSSPADLGNIEDLQHDIKMHFSFFFKALRRVMKPGRVVVVHCQQIMRMKRTGGQGMFDFRGLLIRLGKRAGFIYDYDWLVRRAPQAQAIRTKSRSLQFAGLETDRAQSRGAMGDYLVKFLTPGENKVPVDSPGEVSRNDWIDYAEGCWSDIKETLTLNTKEAKSPTDTRHICALQLGIIERLVRLYSNPQEIVFSPFAGIGSELYQAILLDRRGYGIELKEEYYRKAIENCEKALRIRTENQKTIFDLVGAHG